MATDWHSKSMSGAGADKAFIFPCIKILAIDLSCRLWLSFPFWYLVDWYKWCCLHLSTCSWMVNYCMKRLWIPSIQKWHMISNTFRMYFKLCFYHCKFISWTGFVTSITVRSFKFTSCVLPHEWQKYIEG
jgi:hypothetical protein